MVDLKDHFHLFVYGTLKSGGSAASLLAECELIGSATVGGVLYDIDGQHPALVMYGSAAVHGEIWRCPMDMLGMLDSFERVDDGLFRRVGAHARIDATQQEIGCWTYVAGPALSHKLTPQRRVAEWAG